MTRLNNSRSNCHETRQSSIGCSSQAVPLKEKGELADHKTVARSREYYKASIDGCKEQWAKIEQLTKMQVLTRRELEDLEGVKHCFTATTSVDYQQSKLIPSWGKTEQPGSTYYLQKVSHDIFGVTDHSNNSVVYTSLTNALVLKTPTT